MSKIGNAVIAAVDGVAIGLSDPKTNQDLVLPLSAEDAHELGIALCTAAWESRMLADALGGDTTEILELDEDELS
jgi:hypothetical protein